MYRAAFMKARGWRVMFNDIDICGAISERVARETATALNAYRAVHP